MADLFKTEFDYYLANQDSLVEKYDGKVVVIIGEEILGVYDSELEAYTNTAQLHAEGTFMIQRVSEGEKDYTATFNSRVAFPSIARRLPRISPGVRTCRCSAPR